MSHQLVIHSVSFVQKRVDVGHGLDRKRRGVHAGSSTLKVPLSDPVEHRVSRGISTHGNNPVRWARKVYDTHPNKPR